MKEATASYADFLQISTDLAQSVCKYIIDLPQVPFSDRVLVLLLRV